ncbi:MAG: hypothetical protein PHR77_16095 [Kiritimatiellae bacterium]|nr:hypothetical protein [Kiritimatiellia bacterium]MDD5523414.1 hypothetical protein [Kiritimatiellia bacterium]
MKNIILLLISLTLVSCTTTLVVSSEFSKVTKFKKGNPVVYPDFTITYVGYPETKYPPAGYRAHNFKIESKSRKYLVHYINGGEVSPAQFEVQGQKYMLELVSSLAAHTILKNNEMIIWKFEEWQKRYHETIHGKQ